MAVQDLAAFLAVYLCLPGLDSGDVNSVAPDAPGVLDTRLDLLLMSARAVRYPQISQDAPHPDRG